MKYMITFSHEEGGAIPRVPGWEQRTRAELEHARVARDEFQRILEEEKCTRIVFLESPRGAQTVRLRPNGCIEVTDGHCAHATGTIGGYFIIEAESMGEAVEWAKMDRWLVGTSEVRRIKE